MTVWHFVADGNTQGPIQEQQLRTLLMEGSLDADTLVWTAGMPDWREASRTPALQTRSAPPPVPIAPVYVPRVSAADTSVERDLNQPDPAFASGGAPFRPGPAASKSPDWYYMYGEEPRGPIPEGELRRLVSKGAFDVEALIWTRGMTKWQKLRETRQFAPSVTTPLGGDTAPLRNVASTLHFKDLPFRDMPFKDLPVAANLRVGEVLRQSLTTLWARLGTWLLLGAVHQALSVPLLMAAPSFGGAPARSMVRLASLTISMLVGAIIIFGAFQTHCGQHFHLGQAVQRGFQRFLPILAMGIGVIASFLLLGIFSAMLGLFNSGGPTALSLLAAGSIVLCGLFFAVKAFVAIPACIVDALPLTVSLSRSFSLTKPHFWKVLVLVLAAITPLLLYFVAIITTLVLVAPLRLALAGSIMQEVLAQCLLLPFHWLPSTFSMIVAAITYAKLQAPSGLATERIAEVFN